MSCETANWWLSFDKEGWSKCANDNLFITGFYRSAKSGSDGIYHLEKARCCGSSARYQGESRKCVEANWWTILDRYVSYSIGSVCLFRTHMHVLE